MSFIYSSKPLSFAHRGGAKILPENTLYAFQEAVSTYKADVIELDINVTYDGELVVIHDTTVDRTTNGQGRVQDILLKDLQKLDAGWQFTKDGKTFPYRGMGIKVPTLREVFEMFHGTTIGINIDVKRPYPNVEQKIYNLITGMGMVGQVLVCSAYPSVMRRFRSINRQGVLTGADGIEGLKALFALRLGLSKLYKPKDDAMQAPMVYYGIQIVTDGFVKLCKDKSMKLHVWIIDEEQEKEMLLQMGVDGIITDRPDRLLGIFQKYGYK